MKELKSGNQVISISLWRVNGVLFLRDCIEHTVGRRALMSPDMDPDAKYKHPVAFSLH